MLKPGWQIFRKPLYRKLFELFLKVLILVLLGWAIYAQAFKHEQADSWVLLQDYLDDSRSRWILALVIVLMPLNWGLETAKWQMLMKRTQILSFPLAFKAVLSGVTMAMFTPNRIGEYAGRLIFLKHQNRLTSIIVTILGSFSQIVANSILGMIGAVLYIYWQTDASNLQVTLAIAGLILGSIILLAAYYKVELLDHWILRFKNTRKLHRYLKILRRIRTSSLNKALALSALRYITFTTQYLLLLKLFGLKISVLLGVATITLIFLIQSVIPSIALAELGIRGNVALFLFQEHIDFSAGILAATFILWVVNLIIPAVLGALFLLRAHIIENR